VPGGWISYLTKGHAPLTGAMSKNKLGASNDHGEGVSSPQPLPRTEHQHLLKNCSRQLQKEHRKKTTWPLTEAPSNPIPEVPPEGGAENAKTSTETLRSTGDLKSHNPPLQKPENHNKKR